MKNIFNKLIFSLGFSISLIGCPRSKIYETKRFQEADFIQINEEYFFKGKKIDFSADENYAKMFCEDKSAIVEYKTIYEFVEGGYVNEYGIKKDLWVVKKHQFLNAWPKNKN